MTLLPCRACGRHVRSGECRCPFCGAARSCDEKPPHVEATGRRLKVIAVSAAVGLSACGSPTARPPYGAAELPDAGKDAPGDSTPDSPAGQPPDGGVAPVDGGN